MTTLPMPVASATAEPEMPANTVLVSTVVMPTPPRRRPTTRVARPITCAPSFPLNSRSAVRMKKGMARIE
jgi:hypothetical protein